MEAHAVGVVEGHSGGEVSSWMCDGQALAMSMRWWDVESHDFNVVASATCAMYVEPRGPDTQWW